MSGANTADIIDEIKEQEQKKWFKSRRQIAKDVNVEESVKQQFQNISFHLQNSLKITGEFKVLDKIERIIVAGVGINAVAGDIFSSYVDLDIEVIKNHFLPESVNNKTLVFVLSKTGDEEESILVYKNALRKGCKIVGITSGGRLGEGMKKNNTAHILIPMNINESASLPYLFLTILKVLDNSKLIAPQDKIIDETISALKKSVYMEFAKKLAENIDKRYPVIYASDELTSVSKYWSYQLATITNIFSQVNNFTDLCYGELNVFSNKQDDFYTVILRDQNEDQFIEKSMKIAKKHIKNSGSGVTEILIKGSNPLSKLFSAAAIGDWIAYFLAEERDIFESDNLTARYKEEFKRL